MDVRPLHDRIIVRRLEEGEQNSRRDHHPGHGEREAATRHGDRRRQRQCERRRQTRSLDVKAGDLILFGKYTSQEVKLDGEDYLIMREDEVLAVIETS